jgi:hypothetical protein
MYCKVKKAVKYNLNSFDITINVTPEELDRLRNVFGALANPEIETILDSINKCVGE